MRQITKLGILGVLALLLGTVSTAGAAPEPPKLLVLVVFDQLRGDYVARWSKHYSKDGFERIKAEGAWYDNCHYPYAGTFTGPGHASLMTGCSPNDHGIVGNSWYDRKLGKVVNCVTSPRHQRVPAPIQKEKQDPAKDPPTTGTAERLIAETFGDVLKKHTQGKGKLVGLSFKDRGAILPVGAKADAAYWVDSKDGMLITSTFFRAAPHAWVSKLNQSRMIDQWFGKNWDYFVSDLDYTPESGPDDIRYEGKGSKQGITFPHPTDGGLKKPGSAYYSALYNSPYGNEFLLEVAKTAIVAESLGKDDVPDLLTISFSSNDSVGHCWGPDSHEVMDMTIRTDRIVAELLKYLDATVGKGEYLLCLSADHGICPLPEVAASKKLDAQRLSAKLVQTTILKHLDKTFPSDVPAGKTKWINSTSNGWVYLNEKVLEARKLDAKKVSAEVALAASAIPGVARMITAEQITSATAEQLINDPILAQMKLSYHPERCGEVTFVLKPYWLFGELNATGTTHGAPYEYDTHVPLMVYGKGVQHLHSGQKVAPQAIASIFAEAVGCAPPAKAAFQVPQGLFAEDQPK